MLPTPPTVVMISPFANLSNSRFSMRRIYSLGVRSNADLSRSVNATYARPSSARSAQTQKWCLDARATFSPQSHARNDPSAEFIEPWLTRVRRRCPEPSVSPMG
jgi:hypothetical protein